MILIYLFDRTFEKVSIFAILLSIQIYLKHYFILLKRALAFLYLIKIFYKNKNIFFYFYFLNNLKKFRKNRI